MWKSIAPIIQRRVPTTQLKNQLKVSNIDQYIEFQKIKENNNHERLSS